MNKEHIFHGLHLHPDAAEKLAVQQNADMMANVLGYEDGLPENTPVTGIAVCNGRGQGTVFKIGPGKYASAIFAHTCHKWSGETMVPINKPLMQFLTEYMGKTVVREALETKGKKHGFVWAMFENQGGWMSVGGLL